MSTNDPALPRYRTFDPSVLTDESGQRADDPDLDGDGAADRAVRYLTLGILGVCLALWALVGFVLWIPLLLRSMLGFSLALGQSMLRGGRPTEAGRRLRRAVDFYRRGFLVAIDAVVGGDGGRKTTPDTKLSFREGVLEIGWAALVWYGVLLLLGLVDTSPMDAWNAVATAPWGEWWQGLENTVVGWLPDSSGATEGLPVDTLTADTLPGDSVRPPSPSGM